MKAASDSDDQVTVELVSSVTTLVLDSKMDADDLLRMRDMLL